MMSSDQTVTAIFVPTTHTLAVSRAGGGSGSVAGTRISCPGTCSARYASGTLVTLIATAASDSAFSGWSGGGCRGTGSCAVTLSSDQTVTATFIAVPSITAFKLTHTRFTVGPRATAINARAEAAAKSRKPKVPQGSAFLYTLSQASTATIVIERQTPGRLVGKKCIRPTKANAKKKRCTITTRVGTLTRKSKTGRNTVAFSGRIGRKALATSVLPRHDHSPHRHRPDLQAALSHVHDRPRLNPANNPTVQQPALAGKEERSGRYRFAGMRRPTLARSRRTGLPAAIPSATANQDRPATRIEM